MTGARKIPTVSLFRFYLNANRILKNPLPFHRENFERSGGTFQIQLGFGKPVIFSRDAAFAKYVLQKNHRNYRKSPIQTKDIAKYLGNGLLTAEGEHWRQQRKLLQPAFHKKQLLQLLTSIRGAVHSELDRIRPGEEMDIFPIFNDLAFQVVVKSLFSSAANQEEIDRLQFITESAQRMLVKELRQPYKGWWFSLSGQIAHHLSLTGEARSILEQIVEDRKHSEREGDLLDMLLEARYENGKGMSLGQLIDEILILFTAGHETTSNALTFAAQLLANHPNYQEKIALEVREAKSETGSLMEFIQRCRLTQHVVEESLRLYPPAYFIDRMNKEEDRFDGMVIPKGSSVLFSLYEIHRHPDLWENPDRFLPERFQSQDHSDYYFPFGAGPRKCIGSNFAMYEMILCIAEMVRRYRIIPKDKEIGITPLITLKPNNAVLRFEKR